MQKDEKYITPTKDDPIFRGYCDDFGFIDDSMYKRWMAGNNIGDTFAVNYTDAITKLHKFIQEYQALRPGTKYSIYIFMGELDRFGCVIDKKIYSITEKKAKQYKLK